MSGSARRTASLFALVVGLLPHAGLATGQTAPDGRPRIVVSRTDTPPVVDGRLDDPLWQTAARIDQFTQSSPVEGALPTERTEVWLARDDRALLVGGAEHDHVGGADPAVQLVDVRFALLEPEEPGLGGIPDPHDVDAAHRQSDTADGLTRELVAGADVAESQVDIAKELAHEQGLSIDFRTAPAEDLPFDDSSFDVITANQCWLYFDLDRTLPELRRVARPGARLVTSHFTYLPRASRVARETERLVLRYNPKWSAADWDGRIPANPRWSRGVVTQRAMFYYDELIPFTWESWRGRMRAHRGVGASLTPEEVEAFDRDLDELLRSSTPEGFTVVHRIDAHAFELDDEPGASVPES